MRVAPFASFVTWRATYALGWCRLDVDDADFGIAPVIEIECMCADNEDAVALAYETIDEAAAPLLASGVLAPAPALTGGKLEQYLRLHCPAHVDVLVEAGVLQPGSSADAQSA